MNALHEPWNDDALSEDLSWGAAPALANSSEALADTAASGGAAAAAGMQGGMPSGLAALGPGQELDLGVSYRGLKVRPHDQSSVCYDKLARKWRYRPNHKGADHAHGDSMQCQCSVLMLHAVVSCLLLWVLNVLTSGVTYYKAPRVRAA
jgi:hypothetical protein